MENWEQEIDNLESLRVEKKLNFNSLEKLSNINRSQLKRFFEKKNIPSVKMFFQIKNILDNYIIFEVAFSQIEKEKVCDCSIVNGLLRRGKIKCILSKKEHKF